MVLLRVLAAWWWRAAMDCPIIDMATFRVLWKGFVGRFGVGGNDVLKSRSVWNVHSTPSRRRKHTHACSKPGK